MKALILALALLTTANQAQAAGSERFGQLETARIKEQMFAQSGDLFVRESYPSRAKIRLAKLLASAKTGGFECYTGSVSGSIVEFTCVMPVTRGGTTRFLNLRGDYISSRLGDDGYGVSIDEESLVLVIGG